MDDLINNKLFQKDRHHEDPFSQLMFGKKNQSHTVNQSNQSLPLPASLEKYLNGIDVNLLYENIDLFMQTAQQLKPIYHQISPYIMQFIKKK